MNKRDFLKSALAAAVVPMIKNDAKPEAEPEQFKPDFILDAHHPLGRDSLVFLDGAEIEFCIEAHVKKESFERPVYGELIVPATRPGLKHISTYTHDMEPGEFPYQGSPEIVKRVTGKVLVIAGGAKTLIHESKLEDWTLRALTSAKRKGRI